MDGEDFCRRIVRMSSVWHDGGVRTLSEWHVEHRANLLDALVLDVDGVAGSFAVLSLYREHGLTSFVPFTAPAF